MNQTVRIAWDKIPSLRGCLAHRKQITGRRRYSAGEDPFTLFSEFIGDTAKLFSSKTWRLMSNKTQVFTHPENPFVRTRATHSTEVLATAVVIADLLGLNTDLVSAGAIGHDIGHVPFGHQGESWMAKAMGRPEFCHEIMGPIIAQKIERKGKGLNLTYETLEAMLCHSGNKAREGMTQEAWVLRYADKITYIFHDLKDIAERMRYPISKKLQTLMNYFGSTQRERASTAIAGLVIESAELGKVSFEHSDLGRKFKHLRDLMYEVYPHVTQQNVGEVMEPVLEFLRILNLADPFLLLALMRDRDVLLLAREPVKDMRTFNRTALAEMVPYLGDIGEIDLCDPDLNW